MKQNSVKPALNVKNELNSKYICLLKKPDNFLKIITESKKIAPLFAYVEIIANSAEPVLITGETGVGKELFARAVYEAGEMSGRYIKVNVAGIDDLTFSDTLFGHKRGAYTGADSDRTGLLRQAEGGAILLDEIGDLSLELQVKLLRLIDKREYYSLGSDVPRRSSARIIAVTNRDIQRMVADGAFRKDLFYRLDAHSINIPPLRERLEDLPPLIEFFLPHSSLNERQEIWSVLNGYPFPGNVRELKALLTDSEERSLVSGTIAENLRSKLNIRSDVSKEKAGVARFWNNMTRLPTIKEAVDTLITEALDRAGGNQSEAAGLLGISRQALSRRLMKHHQ